MNTSSIPCAVCSAAELHEFDGFPALPRVTSDSRPFPAGGKLAHCQSCGALQKIADDNWLSEIRSIYAEFAIYHQAGGAEQVIFDAGGQGQPRSERLMGVLQDVLGVPGTRSVLDFGCGNGATLRAMARRWPQLEFYGAELGSKNEAQLQNIPNFKKLYTCPPADIDNRFALITLIHSLEHLIWPVHELRQLGKLLAADGQIFVQVPDIAQNPYDLIVADHRLHFTKETLEFAMSVAGFAPSMISDSAVVKELSYLGHARAEAPEHVRSRAGDVVRQKITQDLVWLSNQIERARGFAASGRSFGIFGSSISATWLAGGVGRDVDFFVDEDAGRVGREHMGRPIVSIEKIPQGAVVFVPLIPSIAQSVMVRLRSHGVACQ